MKEVHLWLAHMEKFDDSVATVAKACLFARINEGKHMYATQKAIVENDAALNATYIKFDYEIR